MTESQVLGISLIHIGVASPKDKGKVERDVQTIREQFKKLVAINPHITLDEANAAIKKWIINEHRTTNQKHRTGKYVICKKKFTILSVTI